MMKIETNLASAGGVPKAAYEARDAWLAHEAAERAAAENIEKMLTEFETNAARVNAARKVAR